MIDGFAAGGIVGLFRVCVTEEGNLHEEHRVASLVMFATQLPNTGAASPHSQSKCVCQEPAAATNRLV
jgi:hypothetical protein